MRAEGWKNTAALFIIELLAALALPAHGERLPIKSYTIAEGLARDYVNRIRQDSHGFIWFCTSEGISRFDGYQFTNYGVSDGLPHRIVFDFLETRDGVYLFATQDGLVRYDPTGTNSNGSRFTVIALDQSESSILVGTLIEDESGTIWCGTNNGVYSLVRAADGWRATRLDSDPRLVGVNSLAFDHRGALWIGTAGSGLFRRLTDGRLERYTVEHGLAQDGVNRILEDSEQRIWVGTGDGLTLLVSDPRPNENIAARVYRTKDGLVHNHITALFQSSDGRVWIGTRGGLNLIVDAQGNRGSSFRSYTTAEGLRNGRIWDVFEDRDRNIWLGAESGGAMKIPRAGFTSYFEADGLGNGRIIQIFADREGRVYAAANKVENSVPVIARFDGHAFVEEKPNLPPQTEFMWGWNKLIAQDREGDWWIPTAQGIYRFSGNKSFSKLATAKPTRVYTVKDGMNDDAVFNLFEDARGDLWFATSRDAYRCLHRWERASDKIHVYTPQDSDIPPSGPIAFANDSGGNLWIGFYNKGIARYANGRFTQFTEKDGIPADLVRDMLIDSKSRLWIATNSGLCRVDNPLADRPQFATYTTADGLASNQVTTLTEDRWGQIYLGTGRGLNRLDPESGKIKRYTTADGLADNFVNVSMRDAEGALWFGTYRGLSRFIPEQDEPLSPPPVIISGLRIAGVRQAIAELGEIDLNIPELTYGQNQMQIDFLSIGYASGDVLRYQFRFEDSDNDWSAPSEQRTITLPNLPPGSYRFLVRAINSDGTISPQPASVRFRILPPVWLRWWFIGLASILVATVALAIIRQRIARRRDREQAETALRQAKEERLRELEQVRRRIAADLHDDIGSSLTRISLLSEVAQRQTDGSDAPLSGPLSKIAGLSRELVDSMSDIVWAINPNKDHLSDLAGRMRHFASDVLTARRIEFHFTAPGTEQDVKVGANVRREVFLIFKEAVNNLARHSGCTIAEIDFQADADALRLKINDNGYGFDVSQESNGHGLASMRERIEGLGGRLEIISNRAQGTTLTFSIPLNADGRR